MSDFPTVRLAGVDYVVKPLVIRQMRVVMPAFGRLRGMTVGNVTEDQVDALAEIVYQAICPGLLPALMTREDFQSLPATLAELVAATTVVAQQAGMTSTSSGEAAAETQTGTA